MFITHHISELQAYLKNQNEKKIGFVPTMGALHEGHLSLVKTCLRNNDICIVSIFVNPTQFNNKEDLEVYPRTPQNDIDLLDKEGCQVIFMPDTKEMYPTPDTRKFDFGTLESVMEGKYRAGHFNGVAQVVSKLFDIVKPHTAYFGEKDFQQIAIIKAMTLQLGLPIEIVQMPILREASGLAMSSRNTRLSDKARKKAACINKILRKSRTFVDEKSIIELKEWVNQEFEQEALFKLDYFEIADGNNLQSLTNWNQSNYIVACVAVYCEDVRLIDNIIYKNDY